VANNALVRTRYPLLSQAILAGASQQLRNMASTGGNLLQRTRCYYFYDPSYAECNKRRPGSGCAALKGHNRVHAILGQSDSWIAVNPSDMSVALSALDAVVQVRGPKGARSIAIEEFHRLPGNTPQVDTSLQPGELITAVDLPPLAYARRCSYIKARDRHSYAFALVSVAAVMDMADDGTERNSRIALGGVAMKPWRARKAEAELIGKKTRCRCGRCSGESGTRGGARLRAQQLQDRVSRTMYAEGGSHSNRERGIDDGRSDDSRGSTGSS
jgi:xanthine dehydrogenase YagS FAD-binding subunit